MTLGLAVACGRAAVHDPAVRRLLSGLEAGTYAVISTDAGEIVARLDLDRAPLTCANFMGLAEGTKPFVEKGTLRLVSRPYYDGLIFHRVYEDSAIVGGDQFGLGTGGPGYTIPLEIDPGLKFDKPGVLAMWRQGMEVNGSQFFITVQADPASDGMYNIFGRVARGLDVVTTISRTAVGLWDRPLNDQVMRSVRIYRIERGGRLTASPPPPEVESLDEMPDIVRETIRLGDRVR